MTKGNPVIPKLPKIQVQKTLTTTFLYELSDEEVAQLLILALGANANAHVRFHTGQGFERATVSWSTTEDSL
jgi:hypothetical protein